MTQPCCERMAMDLGQLCATHPNRADCPDALVGRFSDGRYGLIVHDGGASMVEIDFCPWCAALLGGPDPSKCGPSKHAETLTAEPSPNPNQRGPA